MVDDQQIDLSDISENEVESLIGEIFQQLDFDDCLEANEMTSAQLLDKLHPTFRKHYVQYHIKFDSEGLSCQHLVSLFNASCQTRAYGRSCLDEWSG